MHRGEFPAGTDLGVGGTSSTVADNDKPFFKVVALVPLPAAAGAGARGLHFSTKHVGIKSYLTTAAM